MGFSSVAAAITTLCVMTTCVLAQQELIFASAGPSNSQSNVQPRNFPSDRQDQLVFSNSNNNPTSSGGNQRDLVFSTALDGGQHQMPLFSRDSAAFNSRSDQNGPPIFASSPSNNVGDVRPIFSSGPTTSAPINYYTSTRPEFAPAQNSGRSTSSFNSQSNSPPADYVDENLAKLSKGAERFSLEFLARISNEHLRVPTRSYMVSPLSLWSLLVLLTEGAEDNTLRELRQTLHIADHTNQNLRSSYRQITKRLNTNTNYVEVASYQAIFTDINKPVKRDYEDIIERDYQSSLTPVDFLDVNNTFVRINREIDTATRGLLPHTVLPQDLIDVQLMLISSLYFKGKWKYPFESSNTRSVPFHDESGNITGDVQMMMQAGTFTFTQLKEMESHVIELPYGVENRMSMLVILPKKGVTVNSVMNSLRNVGIASILQQLAEEERVALQDGDQHEVEVFLPKFTTQSHFSTRYILETMGLVDVFQPSYANLTKISKDLFVSSIFQSTRIIVNEEGTEAAAVAVASLVNKAAPVRFFFDRPFAYLIVEKSANLLLFAGEVKSHM